MITELIKRGFANRPRIKWPTYNGKELDRTAYVTASEIGFCARAIVYGKKYPKHELDRWGFAERGKSGEDWVVDKLRYSGANFLYIGSDQRSFYKGAQSGTPDGLLRLGDEDVVLDFKFFDPRKNRSSLPTSQQRSQIIQNSYLMRECMDFNVERGFLVYVNCNDYEDMFEKEVPYDRDQAETLKLRAEQLIDIDDPADAEPEGVYTGACRFCDFRAKCSGAIQAASIAKEKAKQTEEVAKNVFR